MPGSVNKDNEKYSFYLHKPTVIHRVSDCEVNGSEFYNLLNA